MPDEPVDLTQTPPEVTLADATDGGYGPSLDGGVPAGTTGGSTTFGATLSPPYGGGYLAFGLTVAVVWRSGLASAPSASEGGGRVFWRVCSPSSRKVVRYALKRVGAVPVAPHLDTGSDNDVLVDHVLGTPVREYLPDGTPVYALAGECYYDQQVAVPPEAPRLIPNSALGFGSLEQLDPGLFDRSLVGPETPPPGFGGQKIDF